MLDQKVAQLINVQINKELYSAYLYLDFSVYYEELGLSGFANWYNVQAQEERDHAMLFLKYLQNSGGKVSLEAVDAPAVKPGSAAAVLDEGLKHEQYVTSLIHAIYDAAYTVKDFRRSRARRRRTPRTSSRRWPSSAATPRGYICWTPSWPRGCTPRPPWCCKEKTRTARPCAVPSAVL